jgi:predicted Abi (CAAX) family protease
LIAVVFLPVGRLNWPPGWFFIGFLVVIYGTAALTLAWVNTAIYWARSRNRPGMERWERILLLLMLPAVIVEIPDPTQSSATQAMSVRS